MVILGTKVDMNNSRECDHSEVMKWANSEKGTSSVVLHSKYCDNPKSNFYGNFTSYFQLHYSSVITLIFHVQ